DEFFGLTELTQVSNITICASGSVPDPVAVIAVDAGEFEQYEGMLVTFTQTLTISEYFNFDRFGEIVLTDERQFQPTAVAEPGSTEAGQIAARNARNRITLDDGRGSQNPDPA